MRRRRELYALLITAAIVIAALGVIVFDFGLDTAENQPPQQLEEDYEAEAPYEVQDDPPSAIGDIDDP